MRALIVDDARTVRVILRRILEEMGFEVIEADNGRDALTWLAEGLPTDVVLIDWDMPVMSGIAFVHAVRANPKYSHLRIVMVTKETRLHNVKEALAAGANEYIMKPFTKDVVREKLELLGLPA